MRQQLIPRLTLIILLPIFLLAGCKLIIVAETGGSVSSATGNHDCPTTETCEFIEPVANIVETFTALPEPGYKFAGWTKACQGSADPVCLFFIPEKFAALDAAWTITASFSRLIVGTWLSGDLSDPDDFVLLTFYAENYYVATQACGHEDGLASNPAGGHEYGSYDWNSDDGSLVYSIKRNSIGSCGLVDGLGEPRFDTMQVSGEDNTLTLSGPETEPMQLQRISNAAVEPIDGTWLVGDISQTGGFSQVTFYNGNYLFTTLCDIDSAFGSGLELGTYTWNPSNKQLVSTRVHDTMGECGLYDDVADTLNIHRVINKGGKIILQNFATKEQVEAVGLF